MIDPQATDPGSDMATAPPLERGAGPWALGVPFAIVALGCLTGQGAIDHQCIDPNEGISLSLVS